MNERRELCAHCKLIYTNTKVEGTPACLHCRDKIYPSKISVVYPEGSLHQKLAVHSFNHLQFHLEQNPEEVAGIAKEFGVSEDQLFAALEDLYTEN